MDWRPSANSNVLLHHLLEISQPIVSQTVWSYIADGEIHDLHTLDRMMSDDFAAFQKTQNETGAASAASNFRAACMSRTD
jgi:hypothetical protein